MSTGVNGFTSAVEILTENLKPIFIPSVLSRVKLYGSVLSLLKGNKNYFELEGALSYRGFELPRVRVTEGKITVNVRRKSRGNRFWFKFAQNSS